MMWGAAELKVRPEQQFVTKRKVQRVRHYIGTDLTDVFDMGRGHTSITLTLVAESNAERLVLESLLHSGAVRDLTMDGGYYYADVTPGEVGEFRRMADTTYYVQAEFIAKDPIPRDSVTNDPLY